MAYKRPGNNFQYIQPKKKEPRLDISIVSSASSITSKSNFNQPLARVPYKKYAPAPLHELVPKIKPTASVAAAQPPKAINSVDMWGDDDDDEIIMLASQVADRVQTFGQDILVNSMDVSFRRFSSDKKNAQSTQKPEPTKIVDDYMKAFLADEDELVFSDIDQQYIDKHIDNNSNSIQLAQSNFRDFAIPGPSRQVQIPEINGNTCLGKPNLKRSATSSDTIIIPTTLKRNENIQKNISTTMEKQLKFLSKQLEDNKKILERMQQDNAKLTEKCQTKDGEIAMVRYDLQQQKKIQSDLRKEKLDECEKIKNKFIGKLSDLEKTNKMQQTQLEFKNLEIINIKIKKIGESTAVAAENKKANRLELSEPFRLNLSIKLFENSSRPIVSIRKEMFEENSVEMELHRKPYFLTNFQEGYQQKHITTILNLLFQLYVEMGKVQCSTPDCRDIAEKLFSIAAKSCIENRNDTKTIACAAAIGTQKIVYEFTSKKLLAIKQQILKSSVYQIKEMFNNEVMHTNRRLLAYFSIACQLSKEFCELIMFHLVAEDKSFCQILAETLMNIGYAKDWEQYLGMVDAACSILSELADFTHNNTLYDVVLHQLLHSIVFCRPNTKSLQQLSKFFYKMSLNESNSGFLEKLCSHCEQTAILNDFIKKVQFSSETCILQIYAVLLQTEYPSHKSIEDAHHNLLNDITLNTLIFISNCLNKSISWMFKTTSTKLCLCYVHLICAAIVLLYLSIKQWIEKPELIELKTIARIARLGILFISDHFVMHYEDIVLRIGGESIKQRLQTVFHWINQNATLFQFHKAHFEALNGISYLRRIPHMMEMLKYGDEESPDDDDENTEELGKQYCKENIQHIISKL